MSNPYYILAFICGLLSALSCRAQKMTSLDFDLKGLETTDTLVLQWGANNKSMNPLIAQKAATDRTPIRIPTDEPRLITLGVKGYQGVYELLVSPDEEISVTGRAKKVDTGKTPEIGFRKMRIRGAAYQDKYEAIIQAYREFQDSLDIKVFNEYKDVYRLIEKAKASGDEQAIADMYQTLHGQSYVDRVMSTFSKRQDYMHNIVDRHSDSFLGPLLLLRFAGPLNKNYRSQYDRMSETAKKSYYGRTVRDEVYPMTLIDEKAPAVNVTDTAGAEHILSLESKPGRYLILDFWASWCEPCRKEISNLKAIYERYHDKGLDIIGISADHEEEAWIECLHETNEPWENYLDVNRQAVNEYKVQYIPSLFVIDHRGVIIAEKLRGKELSDYIDSLFK